MGSCESTAPCLPRQQLPRYEHTRSLSPAQLSNCKHPGVMQARASLRAHVGVVVVLDPDGGVQVGVL